MIRSVERAKKAFTLLEVLISIGLLGIIVAALFSTVAMMRDSNTHLLGYLEKAKKTTNATNILYLDIVSSDGNLTIKHNEYARLCINKTKNSLYALSLAKVCWLVLKNNHTLIRVEGNDYRLPIRFEDKVEVDSVMTGVEQFDIYHDKDKVIVILQQTSKKPITFMIQGIVQPKVKKVSQKLNKKNSTLPQSQVVQTPRR